MCLSIYIYLQTNKFISRTIYKADDFGAAFHLFPPLRRSIPHVHVLQSINDVDILLRNRRNSSTNIGCRKVDLISCPNIAGKTCGSPNSEAECRTKDFQGEPLSVPVSFILSICARTNKLMMIYKIITPTPPPPIHIIKKKSTSKVSPLSHRSGLSLVSSMQSIR